MLKYSSSVLDSKESTSIMPPKKDAKKCKIYNRGFCFYKESCKHKHPDKVCDDQNCSEDKCDKRHPNPCKFSYRCTYYKQNICLYSHINPSPENANNNDKFKKLNKKLEKLENNLQEMKSVLDQKDLEIRNIQAKCIKLETKVKHLEEETGEIEERVINQSLSVLENSVRIPEKEIFKCEKCNFSTESERGLKVHIKRKHANLETSFPLNCDFCEIKCYDNDDLENHLKEHTYITLKFKCEDCEFLASDELSLEVHAERKHTGNFECPICTYKANSEDSFNIHLHTCETFTCDFCFNPKITLKNLPDLMTHLSTKHPKHFKTTNITHTKMDRGDSNRVSQKSICGAYFLKNTN